LTLAKKLHRDSFRGGEDSPYALAARHSGDLLAGARFRHHPLQKDDALTDISGLASLKTVEGTLEVTGNAVLCQSVIDAVIDGRGDCTTVRTSDNGDGC
jgi:hypothetical protein